MSNKPKTLRELSIHFKRRAYERHGLIVTNAMYDDLNKRIKAGKAGFIKRESKTRSHWLVDIDGLWVYVVYNSKVGGCATALPGKKVRGDVRGKLVRQVKASHGETNLFLKTSLQRRK